MNALTENKPRAHYVDNVKFYEALVQYRAACEAYEGWPETYPQVPNFIGESIVAIATNLAYRPNFNGYSWRDEMIGDAIENCLRYVKSFDIDNYKNPHAYFTQCCWYKFIERIKLENKQSKIKRSMVRYAGFDTFALQAHDETGEFTINMSEYLDALGEDDTPLPKPVEIVPGPLEGFFE